MLRVVGGPGGFGGVRPARRRGRVVAAFVVCVVVVGGLVGGCGAFDGLARQRGKDRVMVAGQVSGLEGITPGSGAVLVTAAEKERLGYERPEGVPNGKVQAKALEHRDEIFEVAKRAVEKELGREVEMVGLDARYPYSMVDVHYRTVDEPIVASNASVGLTSSGEPGGVEAVSLYDLPTLTVMGLFQMAYREEIAAMIAYLRVTYPQYQADPVGRSRFHDEVIPDLGFNFDDSFEGEPPYNQDIFAATDAISGEYAKDPARSDAQWREVFEKHAGGVKMYVYVNLMLKDPAVNPTEAMALEVGEDLRSNPLFSRFSAFGVSVSGNLMMRDGESVHENFLVKWDDVPEWRLTHMVDGVGGSVR